jgi:2-phospho-L-lactate guanylyltransferase
VAIAVIVPVKEPSQAKSRLSPLLCAVERQTLSEILLTGVLDAVERLRGPLRKLVVTSYAPAIAMAEKRGLEFLREARQVSESQSVDQASARLEAAGVEAVLRVPLDLPFVDRADLEAILARGAELRAVLVPSRDGKGTNALYRSPPTLFPSRFGAGSLAAHEQSARRLNVPYAVLPLPSLMLDLDEAQDVETLFQWGQPCPALDYLGRIGVPARLAAIRRAGA